MSLHILRVTVRGEFADPTDAQRADLLARVDDHDISRCAYTRDGTFTYDPRIVAFSYRFEVRHSTDDGVSNVGDGDIGAAACEVALDAAREDLGRRGLAYKRLRASAVDMAEMWR